MITNPILRGSNPDPSILRVGDDYYIATSTFEWFPGVRIHHSRDLVHWRQLPSPLDRKSLLDMKGDPDSGGVWAPNLTCHNGLFYLVYCDVKRFDGRWKDLCNYMVTSESIEGPWSDPIYLNSSGFDASIFHDDDGRAWVLNLFVDHRKGKFFGGIIMQEYSYSLKKLTGEVYHIFKGSELGVTEGPVMMKKDGWYYLITAEGGTEYNHAVSIARSRDIKGPYEIHPENPLLTSSDKPEHPLQKSGHGSIINTPDGKWYISHLAGRPIGIRGRCTLGRETCLQEITWSEDGWPRLAKGGHTPFIEVDGPDLPEAKWTETSGFDGFDDAELNIRYQSLRIPFDQSWMSLTERRGFLALKGQESLCSTHSQSMVALRQSDLSFSAETVLEFEPEHCQHAAGIVYYYNTRHFIYFYMSKDDDIGKTLNVTVCDDNVFHDPLPEPIRIQQGRIHLKIIVDKAELMLEYKEPGQEWCRLPIVLDGSIISDDYVREKPEYKAAFTGAFIGLCCQDHAERKKWAYFDSFEYNNNIL